MYLRKLGGGHHLRAVDLAQSGDVFRHGAGQQFDILRQVAKVHRQLLAVPL